MNFLAHLYLSGDNKQIMVGNFMADAVKGKMVNNYTGGVKTGILMHRWIDNFMDTHEIPAKGKARLHSTYRHYSGVVNDVFYDHFLARYWSLYSTTPLWRYSVYCYFVLMTNWFLLPESVRAFLPNLIMKRRLTAYATLDGIADSLDIMSRTSSLPNKTDEAMKILQDNYEYYREEFNTFFVEIIKKIQSTKFE